MNDLRTESERHLKHMHELLGDRFNELSFMVNSWCQETNLTDLKAVNLNLEKIAAKYLSLNTCHDRHKFLYGLLSSFPLEKFDIALSYTGALIDESTQLYAQTLKDEGVKTIIRKQDGSYRLEY